MLNKIREDIRIEKMSALKKAKQEEEARKLAEMDSADASNLANSKIMTTLFPEIIRNQQDVIRRFGDDSNYALAMEQALKRQDEQILKDVAFKKA
jgi:hypothetical protein